MLRADRGFVWDTKPVDLIGQPLGLLGWDGFTQTKPVSVTEQLALKPPFASSFY
jgi:hypothetical protein